MKITTLFLLVLISVSSCKKHKEPELPLPPYEPPVFDGNVTIRRDTFDRYVIFPNKLVAGDTTGTYIAGIGLQRSLPHPADTNWRGRPIYEKYIKPGYFAFQYVGGDSLFHKSNAKILDGYIDYTLPSNLLGKVLFDCFVLHGGYSGDTTRHTYLYASSDSVHILVQASSKTLKATYASITNCYNYLINKMNRVDTPWFHRAEATY